MYPRPQAREGSIPHERRRKLRVVYSLPSKSLSALARKGPSDNRPQDQRSVCNILGSVPERTALHERTYRQQQRTPHRSPDRHLRHMLRHRRYEYSAQWENSQSAHSHCRNYLLYQETHLARAQGHRSIQYLYTATRGKRPASYGPYGATTRPTRPKPVAEYPRLGADSAADDSERIGPPGRGQREDSMVFRVVNREPPSAPI